MMARYPFFYTQLFCSMTGTIIVQIAYAHYSLGPRYAAWYWPFELVTTAISSTLLLDILRYTLSNFTNTRRIALALQLLLGIAALAVCLLTLYVVPSSPKLLGTLVERGFRFLEAFFLAATIGLAIRNRLPIGRNVRGIILGYGLIVITNLVFFAVAFYVGYARLRRWNWVPGAGYDVAFIIWLISLWRYHPNPVPKEMPPQGLGLGEMSRTYFTREAQA
jgi:hypothetical protein